MTTRADNIIAISADSHICEPPEAFDDIDPAFRDRKPTLVQHETLGAAFVVEGLPMPVPMSMINAAGRTAEELADINRKWDDLNHGGWEVGPRLEAQDLDGVSAEVLYPSVGMIICLHPDADFRKACFDAYNRWLAGFCEGAPDRLIGIGQAAVRTIDEGIEELQQIKDFGFRGVMLAGDPVGDDDYDQPSWDPFWQACVDLDLPVSFHILTSKADDLANMRQGRGPDINGFMSIIRGCQDIMGMMVFGGVFERHPDLKVVCVEADAGWVPHYLYRMDHAYNRHRFWLKPGGITKVPSEYFRENIYVTFQDDAVVGRMADMCNIERIMWANDFPHSDSTWPRSDEAIALLAEGLTRPQLKRVLHDNCAELYKL